MGGETPPEAPELDSAEKGKRLASAAEIAKFFIENEPRVIENKAHPKKRTQERTQSPPQNPNQVTDSASDTRCGGLF